MNTILVFTTIAVTLLSSVLLSALAETEAITSQPQIESGANEDEVDSESARKIIGSRVVTSVSVVMNGKEPQFADAVGNYIPRPLVPPRVASPVSLLDPDRYEFYTFNDDGELVKRLMTMDEIQSIVANGDSEQQVLAKNPTGFVDNEASIRDIVSNVQKVLHSEMTNNNFTSNLMYNKLDTPDTSSSWSSILPAIFGNTGESILASKVPVTTGSTVDSIIMSTMNKKPQSQKTPSTATIVKTTSPPKTTINNKLTKQKPKPTRPVQSSSTSGTKPTNQATHNIKHSTHSSTTQSVKNTYTQTKNQYVSSTSKPTSIAKPLSSSSKPTPGSTKPSFSSTKPSFSSTKPSFSSTKLSSSSSKPTTAAVQKITQTTHKITQPPSRISSVAIETTLAKKPITKRPVTPSKYPSTSALKTSPQSSSSSLHTTKLPVTMQTTTTTKKNKITERETISPAHTTFITTIPPKKKISATTPLYKTTKIATELYTPKENLISSAQTIKYTTTTTAAPITTRRAVTNPIPPTTQSPPQTINPDSIGVIEPEPDNIFDSELSLNQIIESLKDLEGTTMPFNSNYMDMVDMTTFEPNSNPPFNEINSESVTIMNNGQDSNLLTFSDKDDAEFKQSVINSVSYIPQTTMEYPEHVVPTTMKHRIPIGSMSSRPQKPLIFGIEHKESDDDMILEDERTTTTAPLLDTTTDESFNKQSTNMDTLLRESFDSVLSQIQNEGISTIDYDVETTTFAQPDSTTTVKTNDKKKFIVKPTPYIPIDELDGGATEPMKYFEAVIKHYEQEKNKNISTSTVVDDLESTTQELREEIMAETTVKPTEIAFDTTTYAESAETTTPEESIEQFSTTNKPEFEGIELVTETPVEENANEFLRTESDISDDVSTQAATEVMSTIQYLGDATESDEIVSMKSSAERIYNDLSTQTNDEFTTIAPTESTTEMKNIDQPTAIVHPSLSVDESQYEMIQLIENIVKNITIEKGNLNSMNASNSIQRKEDSTESLSKIAPIKAALNDTNREDSEFSDLGEAIISSTTVAATAAPIVSEKPKIGYKSNITASVKAPVVSKLKLPTLAPILNNLKMKVVNALKNTNTIDLEPAPKQALGLEESTAKAGEDILEFTKFCNEVAFNFWTALNNDGISSARSLTLSPFALTSMLAMFFLGARGRTSGEINDMLHLDDIVTFNPHAILRNISESVEEKKDENIHSSAFVRELLSERSKGKILPFFKEKVNQFYSGYVEEVNFSTVNDVIRRRTNLLMKRYTSGKVNEYLKTSNVWVKPPLSGISANIFETDCSRASRSDRDGEMFFQVLPAIRQRRLVPIPAVVWKDGFTAGYDPELDATAVAIGLSTNVVSTIFVMPGQQGHSAPGDNLERLESVLMVNAVSQNAWRRLLATLMERPGLEVQIPRFTHRSFVNTTNALRKLGLETLFDQNSADLRGITGSNARDMYVSDLIQINTFSTCGEDKLAEGHHVEMYPAPPNKHRNIDYKSAASSTSSAARSTSVPMDYENERAFASDPIYGMQYLNLPLPLRPRQARIPENPRLRFDKPFIYFVRHNPTGMVLYFGRFNPRLLP